MNKRQEKDTRPKPNETLYAIANLSQIGITMAASVLVGVLLGKFLDGLFGTAPFLLLIFSFLGVGAAIKSLFHAAYKNKDKK